METYHQNRLDGCLFGMPKLSDYRIEFREDSLPRRIDLRPHCTAVEDQGAIGSCTANACVGALEYFYAKRDGTAPELSRMFVYYNTRRLKGTLHQDSGAMVSEAMAAVLAFGACRDDVWPYDPSLFGAEPPSQAYADGRNHEAIQYARVSGIGGAVNALAREYPVVFGTFLPQRCYDEAARTGRIPATTPAERSAQPSGGHCMLIVGYDLDEKVFIVRNSWGAGWGNGGYCEIPFEEMAWSCPVDSFWTLLELEPQANFAVIRPSVDTSTIDPSNLAGAASDASPRAGDAFSASVGNLRKEIAGRLDAQLDKAKADVRSRVAEIRSQLDGSVKVPSAPAAPSGNLTSTGCYICSATGSCHICNGSGFVTGVGCSSCSATGVCRQCSGTGYI